MLWYISKSFIAFQVRRLCEKVRCLVRLVPVILVSAFGISQKSPSIARIFQFLFIQNYLFNETPMLVLSFCYYQDSQDEIKLSFYYD